MSTVVDQCCCSVWTLTDPTVRFCREHHEYRRADKPLTSVTRVIKGTWPIPPDFSKADPAVVENARDRGIVTDTLFSSYVIGGLDRIPRGTRQDSIDLFFKLKKWWDGREHGDVCSQVILADHEIAGTCDVLEDDEIWDLKCTYNIEATYPLQLAAYGELHFATFQRPVKRLNIIHCTERYAEPKVIKVDLVSTLEDWMILRQCWSMVQRRTKG
jgi:hypothetical protein